jgi:hypothetical protein
MSPEGDEIQQEFAEAQERWRQAILAHRMAPPDGGFSVRLSELADAARAEAVVCVRRTVRALSGRRIGRLVSSRTGCSPGRLVAGRRGCGSASTPRWPS